MNTENETGASNASPTSRIVYILVGLLVGILVGIYGVHNLIAGYSTKGTQQIVASIVAWICIVLNFFVPFIGCVSLVIWLVLLIWTIVDVATVTVDAQGRRMT